MDAKLPQGEINKLTDEDLQQIAKKINNHSCSIQAAADFYGMPRTTFKPFMKTHNFPIYPQRSGRRSNEIKSDFKKMVLYVHK